MENSAEIAQTSSSLELASKIVLTETTLDEVKFNDSTLKCTIAAGELKIDGNLDEIGINVTGPFPVGRQDILEIQASGIDVDDLMKIANSADIGGIGELSAQLSDGTLKGFMEIPNATFNDIPIGTLSGDFRYQEGRVFIENGLMTKNTIEGTSGLQTPPTKGFIEATSGLQTPPTKEFLSRTTITGTVEVEGEFPADISVVADPVYVQHYPKLLLGAEYPVEGEIRGELKLDGTLVNLDGTADFSVTEGVAWGIHLDPLVLPLEVEDYNLTIPDFKITTRGQQVTLNVAVAANADYDLLLENNSPVHLEEIAKAANLPDFPFEGQFDVRVVGKLKKPASADFRVELDFSGVTFLHTERGTKYPLGDVYLLGKLVERSYQSSVNKDQLTEGLVKSDSASTENPNLPLDADTKQQSTSAASELITDAYFDFHGHGFEKTSRIQGYVSLALGNPYRFTAEGEKFDITPILPILHPTLEAVTGTADGNASISGTIADLVAPTANIASESQRQKIYPYDVDILVSTSQLRYETTVPRGIAFTNAEPIRLNLKNDTWTIETLSLRASENKVPFLELTGTLDSQNEMMNLHAVSDGFALPPFSEVLGLPRGMLQTGTLRYDLKVTGTPTQPNLQLEWATPTLTLETEAGDIDITEAGGAITYQEETLRFEECAFTIFGNDGHLEGYVDVQPEAVDSSELHLRVDTIALDLATLPMTTVDTLGSGNGITGILEASIEIGGTLAEPLVLLYAETAGQHPIRSVSYIPSITLERLRVDIHLDSEFVRIQRMEANGQMGEGPYHIKGEARFLRQNGSQQEDAGSSKSSLTDNPNPELKTDNYFHIDVSAAQVEIGDYGFASGDVKLSGTSLDPQQITVIGEINELELDGYDFRLINSAPRSDSDLIQGERLRIPSLSLWRFRYNSHPLR